MIENKVLGIKLDLPEIFQKDLENYEKMLVDLIGETKSISYINGSVVRSAASVGWLNGIKPEDVDEMKPAAVIWIADQVNNHVREAKEVPPE